VKPKITLTTPGLSLPSPRLLRVHAACARVAHLSGVGECILRDMEAIGVLASSSNILYDALVYSVDVIDYCILCNNGCLLVCRSHNVLLRHARTSSHRVQGGRRAHTACPEKPSSAAVPSLISYAQDSYAVSSP